MPHEARKLQPPLTVIPGEIKSPNQWRKLTYPVYILLLIIEWVIDLVHKICGVVHTSTEDITLALESYINEPIKPQPSAKGGD